MSGEIQESLDNFKVIIAFNRRDYFRKRFEDVNANNYQAALRAGIANITFTPIFGLASNLGQLIVITYGLWLSARVSFTYGLLISYLAYVTASTTRSARWRLSGRISRPRLPPGTASRKS